MFDEGIDRDNCRVLIEDMMGSFNDTHGEIFEAMNTPRPCDQCGMDTEPDELNDGLCLMCDEETYLGE